MVSRSTHWKCNSNNWFSTNFRYPLYQRGNPQLRVFLPNFWMKLVKPVGFKYPPNVVVFHCHIKMTERDVKNYLEKIYDIPVVKVDTVLMTGRLKKATGRNYVIKEDDVRLAKVILVSCVIFLMEFVFFTCSIKTFSNHSILTCKIFFIVVGRISMTINMFLWFQPKSEKFVFPDLFTEEKNELDEKTIKDSKKEFKQFLDKNANRPGIPSWFS